MPRSIPCMSFQKKIHQTHKPLSPLPHTLRDQYTSDKKLGKISGEPRKKP